MKNYQLMYNQQLKQMQQSLDKNMSKTFSNNFNPANVKALP
jgi:hypothetical protein